jgi:hypothetical protein
MYQFIQHVSKPSNILIRSMPDREILKYSPSKKGLVEITSLYGV